MILAWLPFDDQLNCRLVCKDWNDLLITLPEFKSRNCLALDYCTLAGEEPPITTLNETELQYGALKIDRKMHLEFSFSVLNFFEQLGENVTYLDISKADHTDVSTWS